ncbi:TonB-dependent siderophore receptor [Zhouia sp. PK063]|uniref:TonB-dependent siderophore receptor n=1 Tax=Zhouia sp. PK063 TaxID=3373602 RepID=UPI003787F06C
MKHIYILACILLGLTANAQQYTLKGNITDEHQQPLQFANVFIKELQKGTYTDEKGNYHLQQVPGGVYHITFSEVGFTAQVKQVTIDGDTTINIQLTENVTALQNVEIIGRKEQSYKNTRSFIGSKTEIALKDLPQAVSYATKELMADQGAVRMGDVLKNFSGVNANTFYDDIIIRGFRINGSSNTQLLNGMRTSTGFWKQPLTNYLERVEVLKGPASALSGNASPGGVVNRVTKKPLDEERHSISFSTGSYHTVRTLGDFTGPLNEDKTLLYRLNIGYEDAGSFRDLQFDKNLVIAPSLSFVPSEKTRVNFDFIYNSSKSRLDRGQSVFKDDLYSAPVSLSLSSANDYLNEDMYILTLAFNHQFTNNFSFSASYIRTGYNEDLLEHRSANAYAKDANGEDIPDMVAMQVFQRKRKRYIDNFSGFFNYKAATGSVKHNIVLGYDYAQEELPPGGSQLQASGYLSADGTKTLSIKSATDFQANKDKYMLDADGNPVPNVPHFDLNDRVASQQLKDMNNYIYNTREFGPDFYNSHGVYVQDHITIDRFKALLGLRYDSYNNKENYLQTDEKNVEQHKILPRLGLTYTVNTNINVYGTYVQGYEPQTASNQDPTLGGPFDPLSSNMVEVGSKTTWFNGRLAGTLALYRIQQKNTLYQKPNSDELQQIGEEESKGVEVDLNGKIQPNWNVTASYAFNESHITKDAEGNAANLQKPNTPKHQGNIWSRYNLISGALKGFGIGAGTNFMTSRVLQSNSEQSIPGYTLVDAALYYSVHNVTLQLNVNNLTNKTYWVGGYDYIRLFPGSPRNWLLTMTYRF